MQATKCHPPRALSSPPRPPASEAVFFAFAGALNTKPSNVSWVSDGGPMFCKKWRSNARDNRGLAKAKGHGGAERTKGERKPVTKVTAWLDAP